MTGAACIFFCSYRPSIKTLEEVLALVGFRMAAPERVGRRVEIIQRDETCKHTSYNQPQPKPSRVHQIFCRCRLFASLRVTMARMEVVTLLGSLRGGFRLSMEHAHGEKSSRGSPQFSQRSSASITLATGVLRRGTHANACIQAIHGSRGFHLHILGRHAVERRHDEWLDLPAGCLDCVSSAEERRRPERLRCTP